MKPTKRRQRTNYVVTREDGVFVARCSDLGLVCPGETEQEAIASLEEALKLYFEDLPGPADG
jgi:predicted RNase H-like HicB family nuclease